MERCVRLELMGERSGIDLRDGEACVARVEEVEE
jgi:hypothetical protein